MEVYLKKFKKQKEKRGQKVKLVLVRVLVDVFVIIGMLAVLNWSISVFRDAGQFYLDQKAQSKTEREHGDAPPVSKKTQAQEIEPEKVLPAESPVTGEIEARPAIRASASSPSLEAKFQQVYGAEWRLAYAIGKAESGLVSKRSNKQNADGTYDWGVMQINDCHCKKIGPDCHEKLLDPDFNIEFSKQIYEGRNNTFLAWSAFKNNSYKRYL